MSEIIFSRRLTGLTCVFLVMLALPVCVLGQTGSRLKGGTARININPPVGSWLAGWEIRNKPSEGISDTLYAKALVLSDGRTEVAVLSADLIGVTSEIVSAVRGSVEKQTGIPGSNILITATHTHFGPVIKKYPKPSNPELVEAPDPEQQYIERLKEKMVSVIAQAHDGMTGVRVGATKGQAPELIYNRRTKRPDGSVVMTFVLPPEEEGLIFGPVDPEVGVLRMENSEGALLGSMINFACHPVSGGGHGEGWESWFYDISADYPAYAVRVVEQAEGGNCLFTLGTAGDMVPIRRGMKPRFRIGRALGGEALRRLQFVPMLDHASLAAVQRFVKLPLKEKLAKDATHELKSGEKWLTTEIQGIRIGDIFLLGLPGEILVELGLEIKKQAGVENLFLLSLSNASIGYVCHSAAYDEGGYEAIRASKLARGAGEMMIGEALGIIEELKSNTR
ncbi:neutral/alkaline non-lysosomal ceramidase N-terminal domain-containing protein [Gemmatimonadota bacterium]